jgi:hypothetical protein
MSSSPYPRFIESTLRQLSKVTGTVFTLEKASADEQETEPLIDYAIINQYSDINQILNVYYPAYRAQLDQINPIVCHVFNTGLALIRNYPLTQEVETFAFSGGAWPYFSQLALATTGISVMDQFPIGSVGRLAPPVVGHVDISFQGASLREAFSFGIDPSMTGIIWISYTSVSDAVPEAIISTTYDATYFTQGESDSESGTDLELF